MQPSPIAGRGYARPELLAETAWLAEQLGAPGISVVDARSANEYAAGHIPGAVHLDGFGKLPRDARGDMGSPGEFASLAGGLGIANGSTVVVYDTPSQRMGMVAWTFRYFGHADVRILDGGLAKWLAEGRPTETTVATHSPVEYEAKAVRAVYCSLDEAKAGGGAGDMVFWDTRSAGEYSGEVAGFGAPPRLGHIPGAVHLDWNELFDAETRTLKPAGELMDLLGAKGITADKQVVSYCNGGARGALGGFVMQILGFDRGQAYPGSFQQWSNQPDTAVER